MTGKKAESRINLLLGILESTEDQNPSNNIIHAENFLLDNVLSTLVEESSSKIISDSELPCKTLMIFLYQKKLPPIRILLL